MGCGETMCLLGEGNGSVGKLKRNGVGERDARMEKMRTSVEKETVVGVGEVIIVYFMVKRRRGLA